MTDAASTGSRTGRLWVGAALALAALALAAAIVSLATREPNPSLVHLEGLGSSRELFSGVPQQRDRLGSADAPVTIQVFNDLQCSSCRQEFLRTIPALAERYARPGSVKLLYRHRSVAPSPLQLGFFGAEAAARQGYGWQYTYLFFVNQDEADRLGIDDDFLASVAGGIGELDPIAWKRDLEAGRAPDGEITETLERYEGLASGLGLRAGQAMIVTGPLGTRTLQDGPRLGQVEAAIRGVR